MNINMSIVCGNKIIIIMLMSTLDEAEEVGFEFELFSTCFWDFLDEDFLSAYIKPAQHLVSRLQDSKLKHLDHSSLIY